MRIDLELDTAQIEALDRLAEMKNVSREELILEAIDVFLKAKTDERFAAAFNLWGSNGPDGLEFQEQIRQEWH